MPQDRRDQIAFSAYLGGIIAIIPHILPEKTAFSEKS